MWKSPAVACVVLCLGCTLAETQSLAAESAPESPTSVPMNARLIIKFAEGAYETSPAFVSKLSKDAGTALTYLRPISVGGHVFECRDVYSSDELAQIIRRLGKRNDIVYVEQDQVLLHQSLD